MSSQPNPNINQIMAVSYPAILLDKRKAANQWSESALMKALEKFGMIHRMSLGATIEAPIDFRRNPGGDFLATDLTPVSLAKTEIISAASYAIAELSIPVVWSKGDDAKNPTENQKISFAVARVSNAIDSHDDMIEEALFGTNTDGFLGMQTIIPTNGQGTVGGIPADTEVFWRNPADTYLADGSDMFPVLDQLWMDAAKGSGSSMPPKLMVSGSEAQALFVGTQQTQQRFVNTMDLEAGFASVAFKTSAWVFSQYGDDKIYGLNPRAFYLVVSKQYFRDKGETQELEASNGFVFKIYSALQCVTNNKSRLFVASEAA